MSYRATCKAAPKSTLFPYTTLFRSTMSPSLLRMRDGAIGLFYLRKNTLTDCRVFLRVSRDERSEEHTSELQSPCNIVCRLLLEQKKQHQHNSQTAEVYENRREIGRD